MREIDEREIEQVSGGVLHALAAIVLIYETAQIVRDFYRGYEDGYNS